MISTELPKAEPTHNEEQNTATLNWRSNQQTQESKIFQQVGFHLEI